MSFRSATIFCTVLVIAMGAVMLRRVRPVEAQSVSGPAVARRFFSSMPQPEAGEGALLQAATGDKKAPDQPGGLPEGKGRDLTQKDCTTCHATSVFTKQHHVREQWRSILDNMVDKGLDAPDSDLDIIADYLTANYGPKTAGTASPDAAPAPAPQ
jgi:cytochrome c5